MTAPWTRELASDGYHDWTSASGAWKAAKGHNEEQRREGKPWTLFQRGERGAWWDTGNFRTLAEAKAFAKVPRECVSGPTWTTLSGSGKAAT